MGTIVETLSDEKGIVWPEAIAPFKVHLISLGEKGSASFVYAEKIYTELQQKGIEVLFDDRPTRAGEKFADSELIGIPIRVVVSDKTLEKNGLEVKRRTEETATIFTETDFFALF